MADYSSLPLVVDASHYQGALDFGTLVADGVVAVALKATQGVGTDPDFVSNRAGAIAAGMPWLAYVYVQPDDDLTTMQHFSAVVGPGAIAMLDIEAPGIAAPVVERWMDWIEGQPGGRQGVAYYGMWPPMTVTDRIAKWPRWFPEYPQDISAGPSVPPWNGQAITDWSECWLLWQYTGQGRLSGVAPAIDLSRLACSTADFQAWLSTGTLPTQPAAPVSPLSLSTDIYLNCSGPNVAALQQRLVSLGYVVGIDGQYGPQTRGAVVAFQISMGLTADGIVGAATIAALNQ